MMGTLIFSVLIPCAIVICAQTLVCGITSYENLRKIRDSVSVKDRVDTASGFTTDFWVIGPSMSHEIQSGMPAKEGRTIYIYDMKIDEEQRSYPSLSIDFQVVSDKEKMLKLLKVDVDRRDNLLRMIRLFEPDEYLAKMLVFCYVFNNHDKDSWTEWKDAFNHFDLYDLPTAGVDHFISRTNAMFILMNSNSYWKAWWYLFKHDMRRGLTPIVAARWFREKVKMG